MPQGARAAKLGVAAVLDVSNNVSVSDIIGLTGGIGSGKSTVAAMLSERGARVINADEVAHDAYLPGTEGHALVVDRFGTTVQGEDGSIDRNKLGDLVFGNEHALAELNAIVHPLVRQEIARRLLETEREDPASVVVIEAALMVETGWTGGAGNLWVVLADPNVVVERLVRFRGMSPGQVRRRLAVQVTDEERRRVASRVIENNGTIEDLEAEVDVAWRDFLEAHCP